MALAGSTPYASFDVTDGAQERDISEVLAEALYYDLNLLGAVNVDFGDPVYDTTYRWNEDALNSDNVVTSASAASNATSITLSSGHGLRAHVGDLFYDNASGSTEVGQITAIATDTLTVTRTYNSTSAQSIASGATLSLIRVEQEASDIGADKSVTPTVRSNFTHIFDTYDLLVSGSQLGRKMATTALNDWVAHQLQNRAIEMKINLSRAALYSEVSASAGSDSVYRSLGGLRNFIRANGLTTSTSEAMAYSVLNRENKRVVDLGVFPDTLLIGTDLVASIAGIDSTVRRLLESDKQVGYVVQEITLNQGNSVRVVVDPRVKTGDYFLFSRDNFALKPLNGRGMFVIAATDFTDAKKRRILGEWTAEIRHPEAMNYGFSKT